MMPTRLVLSAAAAVVAALAAGAHAHADAKLCVRNAIATAAANRVSLPCRIRNEKIVAITNNTGHPIDAAHTPFTYDAIGKYDQKHWCRTFNAGTLAPGGETDIGDRPYASCTAWYVSAPLAKLPAQP